MNLINIHEMIQIIEKSNLGNLKLSDKLIEDRLNLISVFIVNLFVAYKEEMDILTGTNVRFCDYYDSSMLHGNDIISYFNNNYSGKDKEIMSLVFAIYVVLKNAQEIVYNYEICDSPEELYSLLDCDNFFEDIFEMISYLEEKKLEYNDELVPAFLDPGNKYKILFSGFTYEDIKKLEKSVKKAFIRKISGQLSKDDHITLSEGIDHVIESYDFPILRVRLASDYRLAYVRKNNVTVILGVSIKSGKDKDYTRYDNIAKKKASIYQEIDLFNRGMLSEDSQHYKTVEYLLNFYEDEMVPDGSKNPNHSK